MEFLCSVLTYPVRVIWRAIREPLSPVWSDTTLVHYEKQAPDWLEDFRAACPALNGFAPSAWAPDGHMQTLLGVKYFAQDSSVEYTRELLEAPDNELLALDWARCAASPPPPPATNAPLCLLLHGIAGSSADMGTAAAMALRHGMRVVALSKRGHALGLDLRAPRLLNFGDPCDLRHVVEELKRRYPDAKLVAVGSSAGAGLLASYVQQYPADSLLDGMVCICPGYDGKRLFHTDGGVVPWPYSEMMLRSLKGVVEKNVTALQQHVDVPAVRSCSSVDQFMALVDLKLSRVETLEELYDFSNPLNGGFEQGTVPTLVINARDDPVIPETLVIMEGFKRKWKHCLLVLSEHGGHCGFLEGWSGQRWDYRVACGFLQFIAARKAGGDGMSNGYASGELDSSA